MIKANFFLIFCHKKPASSHEYFWKEYLKSHTSIIDHLFAGLISSEVVCVECNQKSYSYEPFLDVSLPIHRIQFDQTNTEGPETYTLNECLTSFFGEEYFFKCYKCESCDKLTTATKTCKITNTPKILVIHLKRFEYFPLKRKNSLKVNFPVQILNMKK